MVLSFYSHSLVIVQLLHLLGYVTLRFYCVARWLASAAAQKGEQRKQPERMSLSCTVGTVITRGR